MASELEVYSIDEAFMALSESFAGDLSLWTTDPASSVAVDRPHGRDWPTKTLAKLANYAANKWSGTEGVVDLRDGLCRAPDDGHHPVDEVWGIRRGLGSILAVQGINTVADLVASDVKGLRSQYGVMVERMCCQRVHLFVRTSPFDKRAPYYSEQAGVRLVYPNDDTRLLLQQVNVLLPQIWRESHRYGVMLSEFPPKEQQQADLFAPSSTQSDALMTVMDKIQAKGLGHVGFASQGTGSPKWIMRQERLSPCCTTAGRTCRWRGKNHRRLSSRFKARWTGEFWTRNIFQTRN